MKRLISRFLKTKAYPILIVLALWAGCSIPPEQLTEADRPSPEEVGEDDRWPAGQLLWMDAQTGTMYLSAPGDGESRFVFADHQLPHASLSPDGRTIAYWLDGYVYLLDLKAEEAKRVSRTLVGSFQLGRMLWAPDGNSLAFDCIPPETEVAEVCRVDLAAGDIVRLSNLAGLGFSDSDGPALGAWSREGNEIALVLQDFPEEGFAKTSLALLDLESGELDILLREDDEPDLSYIDFPSLSPDGNEILFQANVNGDPQVFVYDRQTEAYAQVTDSSHWAAVLRPVWTLDGDHFVASVLTPQATLQISLFSGDGELMAAFPEWQGWPLEWRPAFFP